MTPHHQASPLEVFLEEEYECYFDLQMNKVVQKLSQEILRKLSDSLSFARAQLQIGKLDSICNLELM